MAKTPDAPRKKKKPGEIAVWLLMALVILGLGGFGLENFGGGSSSVAQVGDKHISANDYARQLQQQLNEFSRQSGQNLTMEQARTFGLDRQVLAGLVDLAAQDAEVDRLGVSVGDAVVAAQIRQQPIFQGVTGEFSRETYAFALQQNNLTEQWFEQQVRDDTARQMVIGAVRGGFQAPPVLTDTLYGWMGERRAISVLRLAEGDLAMPLPAPTDADLRGWYDAHIAEFTRPEAKTVSYAVLLPSELPDTGSVDEAAIKALYDARADQYVIPEKRLVERLVFPDQATADAAKAKLDAGTSFEDLVAERGLSLADTDMGDVARGDLGTAGEPVFALTEPGIAGPVMTDLGPALFRVNAILAAQTTALDQVRDELTAEIRTSTARAEVEGKLEAIDDALAGGATLEELASEQGMRLGTFDYAPGADDNDPLAASQAFRTAVEAAQEGDFAEAVTLEDGGIAAIEIDGTVPPTPVAFDKVRAKVEAAWKTDQLTKALSARATEIKAAVEGGQRLETFGIVDVTPQLPREGSIQGAPEGVMRTVFEMDEGDIRVVDGAGFTAVLRVDRVIPATEGGSDADALRNAIRAQVEQGLSDDTMQLWSGALATDAGIRIDQQAIDAVNAQFN